MNINYFGGCLTVHLPHEIKWNSNLMQQVIFIDVFLARNVSGIYAHHQELFWVGGGLESRWVGHVYGADGA